MADLIYPQFDIPWLSERDKKHLAKPLVIKKAALTVYVMKVQTRVDDLYTSFNLTGILPGCRKEKPLTYTPYTGHLQLRPQLDYDGIAYLHPGHWLHLVTNSEVKVIAQDKDATEEQKAAWREEGLAHLRNWATCPALTEGISRWWPEGLPPAPALPDAPAQLSTTTRTFPWGGVVNDRDWTWVSFNEKPGEAVRADLKEVFEARWSARRQAWYIRQAVSPEAVNALVLGVREPAR